MSQFPIDEITEGIFQLIGPYVSLSIAHLIHVESLHCICGFPNTIEGISSLFTAFEFITLDYLHLYLITMCLNFKYELLLATEAIFQLNITPLLYVSLFISISLLKLDSLPVSSLVSVPTQSYHDPLLYVS